MGTVAHLRHHRPLVFRARQWTVSGTARIALQAFPARTRSGHSTFARRVAAARRRHCRGIGFSSRTHELRSCGRARFSPVSVVSASAPGAGSRTRDRGTVDRLLRSGTVPRRVHRFLGWDIVSPCPARR
jgi:hypothetical protein